MRRALIQFHNTKPLLNFYYQRVAVRTIQAWILCCFEFLFIKFNITDYDFNTLPDIFPIESLNLLATTINSTPLSTQLDGMNLDIQTQYIGIKVELAKHQKKGPKKVVNRLKQTNAYIHPKLYLLYHYTERDVVKLTTITFRSLSRLHQILISLVPYVHMPAKSHPELS